MATIDAFPLEAEITLSQLRDEKALSARLDTYHRLRVRRRNDLVGVLLDTNEWRHLEAYVRDLEARLDAYDDATTRALVEGRAPGAQFTQITAETVAEIEDTLEELLPD